MCLCVSLNTSRTSIVGCISAIQMHLISLWKQNFNMEVSSSVIYPKCNLPKEVWKADGVKIFLHEPATNSHGSVLSFVTPLFALKLSTPSRVDAANEAVKAPSMSRDARHVHTTAVRWRTSLTLEMHCGSNRSVGSVAFVKQFRNVQPFRQRRIPRSVRSCYANIRKYTVQWNRLCNTSRENTWICQKAPLRRRTEVVWTRS